MAYSIPNIILWAKITQGLASLNEPKKKALIGGSVDVNLDNILRIERTSLEWQYAQDPTDADGYLFPMGNYVLALIGAYLSDAQQAAGGGGGSVTPITPGVTLPIPYDFEITPSSFPIADGGNNIFLDGTNGTQNFIGYNVIFVRNGITQSTIGLSVGSSYFGWSRLDGKFTCIPNASLGEIFTIIPVG